MTGPVRRSSSSWSKSLPEKSKPRPSSSITRFHRPAVQLNRTRTFRAPRRRRINFIRHPRNSGVEQIFHSRPFHSERRIVLRRHRPDGTAGGRAAKEPTGVPGHAETRGPPSAPPYPLQRRPAWTQTELCEHLPSILTASARRLEAERYRACASRTAARKRVSK